MRGRKGITTACASMRKWRKSHPEEARKRYQNSFSRFQLQKALQIGKPRNGWPDALNIEQKIGLDYVKASQWACAAHWKNRGHPLVLFFAKTHVDALRKVGRRTSFSKYARELGCLKEWRKLLQKFAHSTED